MKKFLIPVLMIASFNSFGALTKSFDSENNCTVFRATNDKAPVTENESIVLNKELYGLSLNDMEIDFDNRTVLVQPTANIVLGLNKPITSKKSFISASNKDFTTLINQTNRKISLFERICIDSNNEVIYAKLFEVQKVK